MYFFFFMCFQSRAYVTLWLSFGEHWVLNIGCQKPTRWHTNGDLWRKTAKAPLFGTRWWVMMLMESNDLWLLYGEENARPFKLWEKAYTFEIESKIVLPALITWKITRSIKISSDPVIRLVSVFSTFPGKSSPQRLVDSGGGNISIGSVVLL